MEITQRAIRGFTGQVSVASAEKLAEVAETTPAILFYMMELLRFEEYMAVVLKSLEKKGGLRWEDPNDKIVFNYLDATATALLSLMNDDKLKKNNENDAYDMRIVRAGRELALESKLIPRKKFDDLDPIESFDALSPAQQMMTNYDRLLHPDGEFLVWED